MRRFLVLLLRLTAPASRAQTLEQLMESGVIPRIPPPALTRRPLLNRVQQGDREITVFLSRRRAGRRTPIHAHGSGGLDCLIQGQATLDFDNQSPRVYAAPACVHMPPGMHMVNVASGQQDTIFYDIFFGA